MQKSLMQELSGVYPKNALPILESSIDELQKFLPKQEPLISNDRIFFLQNCVRISVPIWFLRNTQSFNKQKLSLARSLSIKSDYNPEHLSEIDCAALLIAIGATGLDKIETDNKHRTPDIITCWNDGAYLQVEVVCPTQKDEYKECIKWAARFTDDLKKLNKNLDIKLFAPTTLSEAERSSALRAAQQGDFENTIDNPGKWQLVVSKIPDRDPHVISPKAENAYLPSWWPAGTAAIDSFTTTIGTENDNTIYPRSEALVGYPLLRYINPIERKASRIQKRYDGPLVIAVDITNLPGAGKVLREGLKDHFKIWPDIAGVLSFRALSMFPISEFIWNGGFFPNESSASKIPKKLLDYSAYEKGWDTKVPLVSIK